MNDFSGLSSHLYLRDHEADVIPDPIGDLLGHMCEAQIPTGTFCCTLPDKHSGVHMAGDGVYLVAIWAQISDCPSRPRQLCGCGYEVVWVRGDWEHDAAPGLWGEDHDIDAAAPDGQIRGHWDSEDGVI